MVIQESISMCNEEPAAGLQEFPRPRAFIEVVGGRSDTSESQRPPSAMLAGGGHATEATLLEASAYSKHLDKFGIDLELPCTSIRPREHPSPTH